jgi:hypothetical protein
MSNDLDQSTEMGTKPVKEHEWLKNLVGEWRVETEFTTGPDAPKQKSEGHESCKCMGGLWAISEAEGKMPDGTTMMMRAALGYDVSFKEYRGCWYMSMSSHLWKYVGELSADGKKMTLNCEGPSMTKDGETALYRDVIELIDANHRTLTSYGQDDNGEWQEFMKSHYYRI